MLMVCFGLFCLWCWGFVGLSAQARLPSSVWYFFRISNLNFSASCIWCLSREVPCLASVRWRPFRFHALGFSASDWDVVADVLFFRIFWYGTSRGRGIWTSATNFFGLRDSNFADDTLLARDAEFFFFLFFLSLRQASALGEFCTGCPCWSSVWPTSLHLLLALWSAVVLSVGPFFRVTECLMTVAFCYQCRTESVNLGSACIWARGLGGMW